MSNGYVELVETARDISALAAEAPLREFPAAKGIATVALSGATVMTVMGSPASAGERIIESGDTLSEIAAETGVTVGELATVNGIDNPDLIYAGGTLEVPTPAKPAEITVKSGESPWSIARSLLGPDASQQTVKHMADDIIENNNIEVRGRRALLAAGVTLQVPKYQVRSIAPGDTASEIAKEHGIQVTDLRDSTGTELVEPDKIIADDVLLIPAAKVALPENHEPLPIIVEESAPEPVEPVAPTPPLAPTVITPPPVETKTTYRYEAIQPINGVSDMLIEQVTKYLIEKHGLTEKGAAYLTGNFLQESSLDPDAVGDNGTARGIAQWRFERLEGMPEGDLYAQIDFALHTEMDRDGIAADLNDLLKDPGATDGQLQAALKRWERWGHQGNRFEYAKQIESWVEVAEVPVAPVAEPAPAPQPELPPEVEIDPLDHPLIEIATRRQAPGRHGETIEIVKVAGEFVHVEVAANVAGMIEHAQRDGINLTLTSAWRDIAEQEILRIDNGCPDVYKSSASTCRVPTAIPGTSMHNDGRALDIGENGQKLSNNAFNWLQSNASAYGFKNLPSEPWHWSVNGK